MSVDLKKYELADHSPVWAKFLSIMEAFELFPHSEWVWWLDMDAIILTPQFDIYSQLLDSKVLKGKLYEHEKMGVGALPVAEWERNLTYSGTVCLS
jgi:hypothetical protein